MNGDEFASLAIENGIATICMNRASSSNALDLDMATRLEQLALDVEKRSDVRVLVVRGAGKNFCGGGDIRSFVAAGEQLEPFIRKLLGSLHGFVRTLRRAPQIAISSVHGNTAGGGLLFPLASDLCISSNDAVFIPAYRNLGVTPDGGSTLGMVRAVGYRRALQFFLLDRGLTAEQAQSWGIVNRIVTADRLEAETRSMAEALAAQPAHTLAGTKRLLKDANVNGPDAQLEKELESMLRCMGSPFFRDSVARFASGRK